MVVNAVDDSALKMGDYFDQVADHFGLPRPPRVSRQEAEKQVSPAMLSFIRESRRISNDKMKTVLGYRLRYPTVGDFLAELPSR
jgi:nucleoside-diphosphate-sugar epimerase